MTVGDPGIEVLRRSTQYPRILWAGRTAALGLVMVLGAGLLINTKAGFFVFLVAFLFFAVSYLVVVLAVQEFCSESPGSVPWLVRKSAVAAIQMDLFRRQPPMGRR